MFVKTQEKVKLVFRRFLDGGQLDKGEKVVREEEVEATLEALAEQGYSIIRQTSVTISAISLFSRTFPLTHLDAVTGQSVTQTHELQVFDYDGQYMLVHTSDVTGTPQVVNVILSESLNVEEATASYNDYISMHGLVGSVPEEDLMLYTAHSYAYQL